jgi:WD40 repeat protein
LQQVQTVEPVSPSRLRPHLPRDLTTICLKCLYKEPGRRYATAASLAEDLRRFQAGEPITARPVGTLERTWRWCRRNPRWAAMLATVAALLLLTATVALGLSAWAWRAETRAREKLFESKLAEACARSLSRRLGQRFDSLALLEEARDLAKELKLATEKYRQLGDAAIAALALTDMRLVRQWQGDPTGTCCVSFDEAVEHYARLGPDGNVSVRTVDDDRGQWFLPGFGQEVAPHGHLLLFNPNGRYLVLWGTHAQSKLWRLDPEGPTLVREDPTGPNFTHTFSADGRRLAFSQPDGTVEVVELSSGNSRLLPSAAGYREIAVQGLALNPHDGRLALAEKKAGQLVVEVLDIADNRVLTSLELPSAQKDLDWFASLHWHPVGRMLAACGTLEIYLWDVDEGTYTELEATRNGGLNVAFNHAGDVLASCDWDGRVCLWETHSGYLLFSTYRNMGSVQFSRDDRLLMGHGWGKQLQIWEIATRRAYRSLRKPAPARGDIYAKPAVSPDGRWLAVGMYDGVHVWELATGRHLAHLSRIGQTIGVVFDAEGALWTYSSAGLLRWPIHPQGATPGQRIGPPQVLLPSGYDHTHLGADRAGRVLAIPGRQASLVVQVDQPENPLRFPASFNTVGMSPDGRWVALVPREENGLVVAVHETQGGQLVERLRTPTAASIQGFSPDGRWLAVAGGRLQLWATATWQPGCSWDGRSLAFAPDGEWLAIDTGTETIKLVDPASGKEYARLEDPHQNRIFNPAGSGMVFTPNSDRLITVSNTGLPAVHIWDLQFLREELARLGLTP